VKWVWLLNNDTVPQPDALRQMVDAMEAVPAAAMCGSTMLHYIPRRDVAATSGRFDPRWGVAKHVVNAPTATGTDSRGWARQLHADEYPIGASLLLSREVLERVGLLSEDYFLYYEELDYLHRIRPSFVAIVAPASLVHHRVAAATGGANGAMRPIADYCFARSRMHFTTLFYPAHRWSVLVVTLGSVVRRLLHGRVRNAWAVLVGAWHGWRGRLGADLARRWLENP
jgi:GT2 family glycosyltransferase